MINNKTESSPSIPKNTLGVALETWKPSKVDSNHKNSKRKNSISTPSIILSILEIKTAIKKNKQNHKKLNLQLKSLPPNNHKHQNNNKNPKKRKLILKSFNKHWKNSVWVKLQREKRRKRKRKLKKQGKRQLLPNKNHQPKWKRQNNQQKISQLTSNYLLNKLDKNCKRS